MDKILLYIDDSTRSGAPTQVYYLISSLRERYQIVLVCPNGWLSDVVKDIGVEVVNIPEYFSRLQKSNFMQELFRKVNPSIVHLHVVRAGLIGTLAETPKAIKVIYTEHLWTSDYHLRNWFREKLQMYLLRRALKRVDVIVAVSEAVKKFFISKLNIPENKLNVIYGGILNNEFVTREKIRLLVRSGNLTPIKEWRH